MRENKERRDSLPGTPVFASSIEQRVVATPHRFGPVEWWLGRYRFGPAEWLWRSVSYGICQPMRTTSTS